MSRARFLRRGAAAGLAVAALASGAPVLATAAPAASTPTEFRVKLLPQHVSQAPGFKMALEAQRQDGEDADYVRQTVDFSLNSQKWVLQFVPFYGQVQIVNVKTRLCMQGSKYRGFHVKQAPCISPTAANPTPEQQRQFWYDNQRIYNGTIVHRFTNVVDGLVMGIQYARTTPGATLTSQRLANTPEQFFRLEATS
ncbi:RICIN domain-containing protein [Kribbella sp. NPDC055071]